MKKRKILEVHARLFEQNVKQLQEIAARKGTRWHDELRQLVDHALTTSLVQKERHPDDER